MANELIIPSTYDKIRGLIYQVLRWPYFAVAVMSYSVVILMVVAYLTSAPTYRSDLDLVLPGTGATSNVSLDEVGQVVSSTSTPYGVGGFNPRVNYKEMLMSRSLLQTAAKTLGMDLMDFGTPKVRLTEQTSILNVEIGAKSSDTAQAKAWALYQALQDELDRLRSDEVARRDASIKAVLDEYRERLNYARANIIDFQQRSLLVSQDQLSQLMSIASNLKEKKLYAKAEMERVEDYVVQLTADLGVSAGMAGQAFKLQSDSEFRAYITELNDSSTLLSEYRSRWGAKHPKVKAESARFEKAKQSLLHRSEQLVGPMAANAFTTMDLSANPKRAQLFADLIDAYANLQGEKAEYDDLAMSEVLLADKIKVYSRESAELDRLQREFDVAEAIFTSTAARLEASKADVFASYPVVQLLTPPSIPLDPSSPKKLLGIAAAIFGFVFITSALLLIRKRKAIISLILQQPGKIE